MRVGVIGGGVVGSAMARSLIEFNDIRVYDVDKTRSTHTMYETLESDVVLVCLPTPQLKGARACDLRYIQEFFTNLPNRYRQKNYVIKSTVPIGTTSQIATYHKMENLIHSPEFLTARCSLTDAQIPSRNIIGTPPNQPHNDCEIKYYDLLLNRFPNVPVYYMTSDESEAVKLFLNGFFAVKVAYFNEINALCSRLNMDWETILDGLLSDGRIAHSHTKVPGPDGKFGFGGECLPKDLNNLITCIEAAGCLAHVTHAASERNRGDRDRTPLHLPPHS